MKIADYELGELIGRGNHGRLFKAPTPQRLGIEAPWVAVKVLDQHAADDEYRRFANELKLFASVDSPHLMPILDAGQQKGTLYYATEFCEAGSLADADPDAAVAAVAAAARGAHALHGVGVAHRDIKPTNILITSNGPRLGDLGLAQVLNPGQTVTGYGPIGSVEYMAPSVVRGEPASRASDVFSLGATLHRALCGESIFGEIPDSDILSALRHVLRTDPAVSSAVADPYRSIVDACIAPDPAERPATAEELADLLEVA